MRKATESAEAKALEPGKYTVIPSRPQRQA